MDMSDRYRLRDHNSPVMGKSHALIYLQKGLISCYQNFSPISAYGLISMWHFWCLRMDKMDVITYKYVINICIYIYILNMYVYLEHIVYNILFFSLLKYIHILLATYTIPSLLSDQYQIFV